VVAQEVEFEMDAVQAAGSNIMGDLPELFFCRDMRGYGWCFRKDNYLNVGLGRTDAHEISRHVRDFIGFLKKSRGVEIRGNGISGHAYGLFGHSQRTILDDGILLIGDAAGLAYPESGEGIRPAVESGLMAAHAIACANGQYGVRQLELYRELLNSRLQSEQGRMDTLSRLLPHAIKEFAGRHLLRNRWFCRNVVIDQWFLRVAEQRLVFEPRPVQHELTAI
jgi:flavin-dependent dehydrogenase